MSQILNASITILVWRRFYKWYGSIEQRISSIYQSSQTHRLIEEFWKKIKICFRYSLLGRVTEIEQASPVVLDDSRVVRYLISFYKRWKDKIIYYLKTSLTIGLAKDTKEQLNSSPVQIISIILVITILVNAVLSVILQKQINLWDFLIQVLFLFIAAAGLSCEADWPAVKESSIFLKKAKIK